MYMYVCMYVCMYVHLHHVYMSAHVVLSSVFAILRDSDLLEVRAGTFLVFSWVVGLCAGGHCLNEASVFELCSLLGANLNRMANVYYSFLARSIACWSSENASKTSRPENVESAYLVMYQI